MVTGGNKVMETRRTAFPTLQQGNDRVQTGIPSLDKLIEGGLVPGDTTIVAGQPGTGKTTVGLQFLVHGAVKYGENGVYVSVIESGEKLYPDGHPVGSDRDALSY